MDKKKIDELIDNLIEARNLAPDDCIKDIRNCIIDIIDSFRGNGGFGIIDLAMISEEAQAAYRREYRRRKRIKNRKEKGTYSIPVDSLFFKWLVNERPGYIKTAEKHDGWVSANMMKKTYYESYLEKQKVTAWHFIKDLQSLYGKDICIVRKDNSGKSYRAINLQKIIKLTIDKDSKID